MELSFSDVSKFPSVFFGSVSAEGLPYIFVRHDPRIDGHFIFWLEHWIRELAASRGENLVVHPLSFRELDEPFFSDAPRRPWRGFDVRQELCCDCEKPSTSDTYLFAGVLTRNASYGWFFTSDFGFHDIEENERLFVEHIAYSIFGESEVHKNVVRVANDILLARQAVAK
jgi:hypothetical protein